MVTIDGLNELTKLIAMYADNGYQSMLFRKDGSRLLLCSGLDDTVYLPEASNIFLLMLLLCSIVSSLLNSPY